jgi:aerobic-type carbon monoxide dehydrogenase small subunit (CoxS/CutS family)
MLTIQVNGQSHQIEGPPDTPLLWVLREQLQLTGTKYGCGQALCGACTVHIDGQAVRSCVTPVQSVVGKQVVTIEGLAAEFMQPLEAAWVAEEVPQCGYCQPGQVMAAAALLRATPQPSDSDIDLGMSGNLCRCGTYPRIRKAIHRAAAERAKGRRP